MKTIERSARKILIETTKAEIKRKGFDALWDEIREIYPDNLYDVESVEESKDNQFIFIRLKLKKN